MSELPERKIIGLYGGSFDPVHKGHVAVARAFIKQFSPEKLIIMPCAVPPHKAKSVTANDFTRLAMLKAVFSSEKKAEISDFEIRREGVSYTVDTLKELKKLYPDRRIIMVVGTDMFLTLRSWKNAEEIFLLCDLCVYSRGEFDVETKEYAAKLRDDFGVITEFLKGKRIDVSSTELREKLAEDKCVSGIFPRSAAKIAAVSGVYHSKGFKLACYRKAAKKNVDSERYKHILRVEKAALKLAEYHGADLFKARSAALLHDLTKCKTLEEQLNFAKEFGIIGVEEFKKSPKVAHAFTAAGYAERYFSVSDSDTLNAVAYHTTGRPDMSLLEKIVFLADSVEEGRDFDGVEELRLLAYEDIDGAVLTSLRATKKKIENKGAYLHPLTAQALEFYEKLRG